MGGEEIFLLLSVGAGFAFSTSWKRIAASHGCLLKSFELPKSYGIMWGLVAVLDGVSKLKDCMPPRDFGLSFLLFLLAFLELSGSYPDAGVSCCLSGHSSVPLDAF